MNEVDGYTRGPWDHPTLAPVDSDSAAEPI